MSFAEIGRKVGLTSPAVAEGRQRRLRERLLRLADEPGRIAGGSLFHILARKHAVGLARERVGRMSERGVGGAAAGAAYGAAVAGLLAIVRLAL